MSTDTLPPKGGNRTSQIVTSIIPANTTFPIFQTGDNFYFVVSTGVLKVKPNNGSENEYVQGTGVLVDDLNIFKNIQIRNDNAFPVVFRIFVGFGNYIDNRLIVFDPTVFNAVYSTYGIVNSAPDVLIPDLSGQSFVAADGKVYLALGRKSLFVSNIDTGITYSIQNVALSKTLLFVFPQTSIVLEWGGDLKIHSPSANINAVVTEVYAAILPT